MPTPDFIQILEENDILLPGNPCWDTTPEQEKTILSVAEYGREIYLRGQREERAAIRALLVPYFGELGAAALANYLDARDAPIPVERGSRLVPGRWYRIAEIRPTHLKPSLAVGDVVLCRDDTGPRQIEPDSQDSECWFADYGGNGDSCYGTLVAGLVEVPPPEGT